MREQLHGLDSYFAGDESERRMHLDFMEAIPLVSPVTVPVKSHAEQRLVRPLTDSNPPQRTPKPIKISPPVCVDEVIPVKHEVSTKFNGNFPKIVRP